MSTSRSSSSPVTIREIAKRANVSHVTVSNILNGRTRGVRADARDRAKRVEDIAAELGYRPHQAVLNLRRGRTGVVSLLGWTLMSEDEANIEERQIVQKLAVALASETLHLAVELTSPEQDAFGLSPWRADAAVLMSPHTADDVATVEAAGIPYVSINGYAGPHARSVQFNDIDATEQALDHLHQLGHRRIAFANAPGFLPHQSAADRGNTFRRWMKRQGLDLLPGHEAGDVPHDRLPDWFQGVVMDHGVTAVLTYEPTSALRLYQIAAVHNVMIPGDLSIVTFNDSNIGRDLLSPALSAVARPVEAMAEAAAAMVLECLEQAHDPKAVAARSGSRLPRELLLRGSFVSRGSTDIVRPKTGR